MSDTQIGIFAILLFVALLALVVMMAERWIDKIRNK